jgi:hypothetical protein
MIRTIAAAIFALLVFTTPARATMVDMPYEWYQIDTLDLTFPNGITLTGDLDIVDAAPSVGTYFARGGTLDINGTPITIIGGPPESPILFYTSSLGPGLGEINFYVPPPGTPGAPNPYGAAPLYLSPASFGAISGTVNTEFCAVGSNGTSCSNLSAAPLPAAFPLFGTALAGLGGFGWLRRKRGKVSG